MFYLGATLLGLIAALFACWPLLRKKAIEKGKSLQHDQIVRAVYRERLVELEGETQDPALRQEIENELGAVLLSEEQGDADTTGRDAGKRISVWLIALLIPVCGVLLYYQVADPTLQNIRGAEEVLTIAAEDTAALESWARRLAERTEAADDDSKSWYLLGHAYLKLRRFSESAEAFATTSQLAGEDLNIQVYWLQSRYLAAEGVLDDVSRSLATKILEQQPNLSLVLEILAVDAFKRGQAEESIALLNKAVTGSRDIRQQASFAMAIRQVRESLTNQPIGVSVAVETTSEVPPHASIFVVARPVGGGMPYAAVRRPAFLAPFEVRLDDLVSMSPERKLSDAESFEVVVRLSASGVAMAAEGDWQWQSQVLSADTQDLAVLQAVLSPP